MISAVRARVNEYSYALNLNMDKRTLEDTNLTRGQLGMDTVDLVKVHIHWYDCTTPSVSSRRHQILSLRYFHVPHSTHWIVLAKNGKTGSKMLAELVVVKHNPQREIVFHR